MAHDTEALRFKGVDLRPAVEQQLFFALRDGRRPATGIRSLTAWIGAAAPLAAAAVGLAGRVRSLPTSAHIAVLVRDPTHYLAVDLIEAKLQEIAGEVLTVVRVGRAAVSAPSRSVSARLVDLVDPRIALATVRHQGKVRRALASCAPAWTTAVGEERAVELQRVAADESARIALGAAGLLSLVRRWRPALLVAFDEVGTWARVMPAVARAAGIRSVDLPHAEAADAVAIVGAAYDVMATYGPRASSVLQAAGIEDGRIVQIGAPRLDPLVEAGREGLVTPDDGSIVFAAQYPVGAMTEEVLRQGLRAGARVAEALDAKLVVVPHPAEPPGTIARLVAELRASSPINIALPGALQAELASARLLVTGWSNSVFEAAAAGVPAITVAPRGVAPVDFGIDGLASAVEDAAAAVRVARLLASPSAREAAVARARAAAERRLGPLDGGASERAARLLLSLVEGDRRRSAA